MTSFRYETEVVAADGSTATLDQYRDKALLVVNVASLCGLTPQYGQLQELQVEYAGRGLQVLGFPCNQFGGQEPGSDEEIASFCAANYGVTFPVFSKIEVNGPGRHPLYEALTETADARGEAGDVAWNFEEFLIAPGGDVVARFRPKTLPVDEVVLDALEKVLPA
ncbi:glutathione peroxidase [soil metagenome]